MCLTFIFKVKHQGQVTDFAFLRSSTLQMLESTPRSSGLRVRVEDRHSDMTVYL